jgi:putative redox protein
VLRAFYNRKMRNVTVGWAGGKLAQDIAVGGHAIRSDEEAEKGGDDTGATPHELLLAALGSCTAMTLKLYAERKGWPLTDVHVTLNGANGDGAYIITRGVAIQGDLDAEQRQRLLEIADKCPVHRTLTGEITINTTAGEV